MDPLYYFLVTQIVRSPKFKQEIKLDGNIFKNLSDKEYNQTIWKLLSAEKPIDINDEWLKSIQEGIILSNRLMGMFMWSEITFCKNFTDTEIITCDNPALHNGFRFIPSRNYDKNRLEPSMLKSQNPIAILPINRQNVIMVRNFRNERIKPVIKQESIFDKKPIMEINKLIYQNSERHVYSTFGNDNLISKIRENCKDDTNFKIRKWYDQKGEFLK